MKQVPHCKRELLRLKYDEIKMMVLLWIRNLIVRLEVGIIFHD